MRLLNLFKLIAICSLYNLGKAANILGVFPIPSKSHDILGSTLCKHLSNLGHNVTYISPFLHESQKDFHHIYVKEIETIRVDHMKQITQGKDSTLGTMLRLIKLIDISDLIFNNPEVQQLINSKSVLKFDLLIHFMGMDSTLALAHHFDVPIIIFSPIGGFPHINNLVVNPTPFSYVPNALLPFTENMNFMERTINTAVTLMFPLHEAIMNWISDKSLEKYLPGSLPMQEIKKRIELVLVNTHISTESPRPYVPNMIQIGGFHLHNPKPVDEALKNVLDEAKEGFIYFSFGTNVNVKELGENVMDIFRKVLGNLPLKIIMKYEDDFMENKPDNFYLEKWFPQPAVLAHPNAKLFITHGGYGGCTESLYYGVPMVCIPFFGDQFKNCADAEINGYSITVKLNELSEKSFSEGLNKVLYDEQFQEAVKFKSEMYRDQPMHPMDKAVYWIEHVLKHKGAKHLKIKGADLPWYQYLLVDVFLFLGFVILIACFISICIMKFLFRKLFGAKNKIKVN
ncbi:UDP-glycosyltransferase UGT4-like isoform X1 [Onthophagus taurus]|uniref:UDP-glycosyltransferase UGT4-like isoform X1 n=1 Tax=Onthophagus taurus TaxID=166361 RepID=UPI0039BDBAB7